PVSPLLVVATVHRRRFPAFSCQERQSASACQIDQFAISSFFTPNEMPLNFNENIFASKRVDQTSGAIRSFVGRLTHSLPLARFFNLPVHVARVPAAPFCETPGRIGV